MSTTLKDIAAHAGVSKVTVHKVIYNKPGVSEKTRRRVLDIVNRAGYAINPAASSLKREQLNIAVISLWLDPHLNYFNRIISKGVDEAEKELSVYRVALKRYLTDHTWQSQVEILEEIIEGSAVDGVVIYCTDYTRLNPHFERLDTKGIPVVTFHSDAVDSCRIAGVMAPDERTGRLAAELMSKLIVEPGYVLVLGGNKGLKVLRDNVVGFFSHMQAERRDLTLLEVNDFNTIDRLMLEVEYLIGTLDNVRGVYCNSARNDIPLCEVLIKMGLAGTIRVITSDVFPELCPYMDNGVIDATMWQDPKNQSRKAILLMYQYLTTRTISTASTSVRNGIVMRSNFDDYCDG